jgi:hypothetical protein
MNPGYVLLGVRILIAIALYAFLGTVLWMQWRQLQRPVPGAEEAPAAHLLVPRTAQQAEDFALRVTSDVGRAVGNTVRLQDETVSAQHARITFHGGQWWVEDLASRNGTTVNGVKVDEPLVVTYGDEISFGRVQTRLERGAGSEGSNHPTPAVGADAIAREGRPFGQGDGAGSREEWAE